MAYAHKLGGVSTRTLIVDPPVPEATPIMVRGLLGTKQFKNAALQKPASEGRLAHRPTHTPYEWIRDNVFVVPQSVFYLGTTSIVEVREFSLWHTFERELNYVLKYNATLGMEIVDNSGDPLETPLAYKGMRSYTVTVGMDTGTEIDGNFHFDWVGSEILTQIRFVGDRVVPFTFIPTLANELEYSWSTSISRSTRKEERFALNLYPKEKFSCSFTLDDFQYAEFRNFYEAWAPGMMVIPIWTEAVYYGDIPVGTSELAVDTTGLHYYVGQHVSLFGQDGSITLGVIEVTANRIKLGSTVAVGLTKATVVPAIKATMDDGYDATRSNAHTTSVNVNFNLGVFEQDTTFEPDNIYKGRMVLEGRPLLSGYGRSAKFPLDSHSNSIAADVLFKKYDYNIVKKEHSYPIDDRDEVLYWRDLLLWLGGKYTSFYVPDWSDDFVLSESSEAHWNILYVARNNALLLNPIKHLRIEQGATIAYFDVLGIADAPDNMVIQLDRPLDFYLNKLEPYGISRMDLMRLSSDTISMNFSRPDIGQISLPLTTAPDINYE